MRGFTFLEIIVYMGISSFLLAAIFSTFSVLVKRNIELEKQVIQSHEDFINTI